MNESGAEQAPDFFVRLRNGRISITIKIIRQKFRVEIESGRNSEKMKVKRRKKNIFQVFLKNKRKLGCIVEKVIYNKK